jgi:hypothetical protein
MWAGPERRVRPTRGRPVVGIDLSPEMVKLARRRLDAAVAADMRALPLAAEVVGGVLAFYALIHVRRSELISSDASGAWPVRGRINSALAPRG